MQDDTLLTLVLPVGNLHGWGVCGKYLSIELARRAPVRLVTRPFDVGTVGDEMEYSHLLGLYASPESYPLWRSEIAESPVLQAVTDHTFVPLLPDVKGKRNVGYTFFEQTILSPQALENAKRHFDLVVGGSSWCRDILRQHGLASTAAVFQGVDQTIFNAHNSEKQLFTDRFVVFSGGKFEFRKGQDLVIRAFRVLQERHDDVLLVNAWVNHWSHSWQTMAMSRHIEMVDWSAEHFPAVNALLERNGVDLSGVVTLGARPNVAMARIYRNSDCGLFPNRCEGGTNLALMEYMACGKPAIASNSSGHRDVASDGTALMLTKLGKVNVGQGKQTIAVWDEPDLEEIVEKLEWAYQHPDEIRAIGRAGAESMKTFSWQAAADQFHRLLKGE